MPRCLCEAENRAHGSAFGAKLRGVCNGTKFAFAFA
jgi:hypothetical protein